MKKCCQMLAKYFGVMAVVFLVLGLVTPTSWLWILGKVQGVSVLSVLLGVILAVVVLFNTLGYVLGLAVAKLCGLSWKKAVTLSVEVGMQNSGLATGLAKVHFASMPAAVVPGAIFSAWFTISGAVLAWACVNYLNPRFSEEEETEAVNVRELATD